ncbi:Golgi transport complex subunit 1 [Irineochytrium annulatum]|nr:Golgi transport complex subunit 1 [Irineochytrium annulatum]
MFLGNCNSESQTVAETLCSLMLLEKSSPREALDLLLNLRQSAAIEMLDRFDSNGADIVQVLANVIKTLQWTLLQIAQIFMPNLKSESAGRIRCLPTSLLDSCIKAIEERRIDRGDTFGGAPTSSNIITRLYSEKTNIHVIFRHLPASIQSHVPFINITGQVGTLTGKLVQEYVNRWVVETLKRLQDGIFKVLRVATSGQQLAGVRKSVVAIIGAVEQTPAMKAIGGVPQGVEALPEGILWSDLCSEFSDNPLSLWHGLFREIFRSIAIEIMANSFQSLSQQPALDLLPRLHSFSTDFIPDQDVAAFIWARDGNVLPLSTSDPVNCFRVQTPAVLEFCNLFESTFLSIKDDISALLAWAPGSGAAQLVRRHSQYEDSVDSSNDWDIFNIKEDCTFLNKAFEEICIKAIMEYRNGMLNTLASICAKDTMPSKLDVDKCLFIGRTSRSVAMKTRLLFSQFLSDSNETPSSIIPRLKSMHASRRSLVRDDHRLNGIESSLMEVYSAAHGQWTDYVTQKFQSDLRKGLLTEDWKMGSRFLGIWEGIVIKASADGGEVEEDRISLPVHSSAFIIDGLFSLCRELNRIGGYSTSRKLLIAGLSKVIIAAYTEFIEKDMNIVPVSEKATLQILFDVRFLIKVIEGAWGYDSEDGAQRLDTQREALAVVAKVKGKIDPIDLAVTDAHLLANVDRFYYRSAVLLGSLLTLNPKPSDDIDGEHVGLAMAWKQYDFLHFLSLSVFEDMQSLNNMSGTNAKAKMERPRIQLNLTTSLPRSQPLGNNVTASVLSGVVGLVGAATSAATSAAQSAAQSAQSGQWMGQLPSQRTVMGGVIGATSQVWAAAFGGGTQGSPTMSRRGTNPAQNT